MKKTARRILSAILMSSLLLSSGISTIAATEAPVAVESAAPVAATSNLPLEGKVAPKATDEVSGETRATVNEAPVEVVTIEENTTPLAPKAEAPLTSELPLEGKLSPKATDEVSSDEVSSNEVSSNEASPEELSPAMTISSTTYSGVTVEVSADEGVLPSDAHLFVAEIKSHAGKQTAENALGNTDIEYDDYMVLDIQIRNGQAEEIEPDGNVRVNIMMDASKLPEDADESTLEIQHLAEDENGAVKTVETVADNGNATDGNVSINGDNMEGDFKVGSFSLFTITWRRKSANSEKEDTTTTINVSALILEGDKFREVNPAHFSTGDLRTLDISKDLGKNINKEFTYTVADMMRDRSLLTTIVENRKSYNYQYALWEGSWFDTFKHYPWSDGGKNISTDRNNPGAELNGNIQVLKDGQLTGRIPFGKDHTVYLVYADDEYEKQTLHTVNSLDSISAGIEMYLFKFADRVENQIKNTYGDNNGNKQAVTYGSQTKHAKGQITQDLASRMIVQDGEFAGYPELFTKNSTNEWVSARRWFNKSGQGMYQEKSDRAAQEVNGLFVDQIYKDSGYYYYGSDEFGAVLGDGGQFTLYNEIMSPAHYNANKAFFWRRGNFLPYNTIKPDEIMAYTKVDMSGNVLQETDALYNKAVHAVNGSVHQLAGDDTRGVFNFGMSAEATFVQPVDGMVKLSGKKDLTVADDDLNNYYNPGAKKVPMMFQFNGDDDFWLYIDDVLVLDLGGSHDAQEGYIDFQKGIVYWTNNGSVGNGNSQVSDKSEFSREYTDYKGNENAVLKFDGTTTLYDQFVEAYGSEAAVDELGIFTKKDGPFKEGTKHTMKIYYMEHGGGASNLRMMFNIPVQPVNDLTVSKSFVENGKPKEVPDDFIGTFEVYEVDNKGNLLNDNKGNVLPPVASARLDADTAKTEFTRVEDANGMARYDYVFKNLPVSHKYVVVEKIYRSEPGYLNTVTGKESLKVIDNLKLDVNTIPATEIVIDEVTGDKREATHTIASDIIEIVSKGENRAQLMNVQNHYQTTLTIEKHVHSQNDEDKDTPFEFRLYLKNTDGTPYTQPLGKPVKIGSLKWQQVNGQDDLVYPAPGKNYYEFKLKDGESITLAVPNGIKYLVAENVDGEFKVFRPFTNKAVVLRDKKDDIVFDENTGEALWQEAIKLIPQDGKKEDDLSGFKTTPEDTLKDDTKITFINERQIVRTGVTLNTAPFMVMLAMVFFAAAGVCVKYLRRKNEEEEI